MEGITQVHITVSQGETGVAFATLTDVDENGAVAVRILDLTEADLVVLGELFGAHE